MTRVLLILALAGAAGLLLPAAGPAIGFAVTNGAFHIDGSRLTGNSSLFEGSAVATLDAAARLQLNNGTRLQLAADSRARVYENRAVLEKGIGQVQGPTGYRLEAHGLRISPALPNTVAQVRLRGNRVVLVAARSGAVRVTNAHGVLVANVTGGRAASFDTRAGSANVTKATGRLEKRGGRMVLTDRATNVTFEVEGGGVEENAGNQVEITGTAAVARSAVAGASQLIHVGSLVALKAAAVNRPGAVSAIIGGIGVGDAPTGLAAAGSFSKGGGPKPISR